MNSLEFNKIIENPDLMNESQATQLDAIINEFPYFQAAKAIHLKNLKLTSSLKYNDFLKKTAAHTIDRKVLFDYVTTLNFTKKTIKEFEILEEIEVIDPEFVASLHQKITTSFIEDKIETKTEIDTPIVDIEEDKEVFEVNDLEEENNIIETNPNEVLEIGKPLQFSKVEPHSFNEWMQLITQKPIEREVKPIKTEDNTPKKDDKFSLIDKFIETNPKIQPVDKNAVNIDVAAHSSYQEESLMTETLAKVYLEQKKYDSAIKAYRILSLKYPEKSSFFANRIKAIKILQKNKS